MFRGLAAFPNVDVRLFNPFCCARQSIASKYIASIADFRRLNHRMHNKLFIADGVAAVMGGRNIADEYFTRSATSNFVDMDVFLVGSVVRQLASIFDVYWNSPQCYPVEAIIGESADRDEARRAFDHLVDDGEQMRSLTLPPFDILGYRPISDDIDLRRKLSVSSMSASCRVRTDCDSPPMVKVLNGWRLGIKETLYLPRSQRSHL
jgi:putative cardiolipin synthase